MFETVINMRYSDEKLISIYVFSRPTGLSVHKFIGYLIRLRYLVLDFLVFWLLKNSTLQHSTVHTHTRP